MDKELKELMAQALDGLQVALYALDDSTSAGINDVYVTIEESYDKLLQIYDR